MSSPNPDRKVFAVCTIAIAIIAIYILRLLSLQVFSDDFKKNADSNAFLQKTQYPARGLIRDRNGNLLVYNEPAYNIMVVMNEQHGIDTLDFCKTLGITKEQYIQRMDEIKDPELNPTYTRYSPQIFMGQIPATDFSYLQEKLYKYPGFSVEKRSIRHYSTQFAAHILGDVAEVNPSDLEKDDYYHSGDYIGKLGVEKSYEKELRGEKGIQVMLRDVHGRIQGRYENGALDVTAKPGKNLTLSIDIKLQELGERLMHGKIGSIVAIEPSTGEVLCMVSSPTFDPHLLVGKNRGKHYALLASNPYKPLLNRSIMGQYPPGSTFKTSQGLTFLQEGIITPHTYYPCHHGFELGKTRVGCHGHHSPVEINFAVETSCNGYFCWGFYHMIANKRKYGTYHNAVTRWKDYMVSMGFGYKLGIDLPGEKRGMIPNAQYYDDIYHGRWNALTLISDAIGQGEVMLTPLQVANLGATIANRGYYIVPHVVKKIEGRSLDTLYTRKHPTMVSPANYNIIVRGMRSAVIAGTCRNANIPSLNICGKTGTAQNRGQDHSVFMGFAPMNHPKIAISVYVENGGYGADYGVPIGAIMIEQYINGKLSASSQSQANKFASKSIIYGARNR